MHTKQIISRKKTPGLSVVKLRHRVKAGTRKLGTWGYIRELKSQNEILLHSLAEIQMNLVQFTDLYDFAPMGYFSLDQNGLIFQVNLNGAHALGMERKEILDHHFEQFVSTDYLSIFNSFLEKVLNSDKEETCEIILLKKGTESIWARIRATSHKFLPGKGKIYHLMVSDITEHRRAENILQARLRITDFAAEHSLGDLLQFALDELCDLTNSPIGFFHFVESDQEKISLQTWSTLTLKNMCTAEGKGQHYNISQAGVWADCIREARPIIHNDYANLPHRKGLPEGHSPVEREMVLPIIRNQKVVAVIGVGNKSLDYTQREAVYALCLTDVIWDITEHKRAEEALRQSEARYRSILEDQTELICRYLPDGRLSFVNEAYTRYYGESAQNLINTNFLPHIPEPDMSMVLKKISEITPKEPVIVYEHKIFKPNGELRWQRWSHRGIYDPNNTLIEHQAVGWDITEQKQAEEALRESEERFRYVLENVRDAVWSSNLIGRFIFLSPVMTRIYGRTLDEMMAYSDFWIETCHPDDRDIVSASKEALLRDKSVAVEYRILLPDGTVRWIADRKFLLQDDSDTPAQYTGVVSDITVRKQMESALATEKRRLADILKGTNAGTWEWNVQTGETIYNERWAEIVGYTLDELSPVSIDTWKSLAHPDDFKRSEGLLERHFKGELDYYECEARLRHKSGQWVWVLDRGKVATWTKEGKPLLMSGTHQDITERKLSEEQIQLLAKFPAEDPNPVLRIARDGTLLYSNEAGLTLLPQWDLQIGKLVPSMLQEAVFSSMQDGHTQTLDLDHGDRLYAFYVAPIVSAGYANLYGHDITESRQVKALQDAETRYHVLFDQSPYGVLLVDPETGSTIEANEIASRQLGYSREEFSNMKISDYETAENPEQVSQHMQKILREGSDDFETIHCAKNGESRNVHVWVKQLQLNSRFVFYAIYQDITERKRMEESNEDYSREITLLEERQRIASDLHDAVSQTLFSARLTAETLLRQSDRQTDSFTRSLMDINRLVRSASGEIRLILVELRNNALLNVNLTTLLTNLIDSGRARTNADLIFQCQVGDLLLPYQVKLAYYRIAQEAMSNAIKHGKPKNINCNLSENNQILEMTIHDDGIGFSVDKTLDDHFGLKIMRERADLAGVELIISTQPGSGTSVKVCWEQGKYE
jgi:PAS domain S-box-containing protein